MIQREFLEKVKGRLAREFGGRFQGIVLYGSEARGEAEEDSDVDILVLLRRPVAFGRDLRRIIDATYPVQLECDRFLSAIPVDEESYRLGESPFLREARREGVTV